MTKPIAETRFCTELDNHLAAVYVDLKSILMKKGDALLIMKLFSGIYLLQQFVKNDSSEKIDVKALNSILQKYLGIGHTWVSCIQFLSGAKAQNIHDKYQDLIAGIGGTLLSIFSEYVLTDIKANVDKILYSGRFVDSA